MHSRDGDVHGVRHGVGRHDRFSKKSRTKLSDRRRESERRNVPQHVIASLGGLRIPAACLLMHQFRHEQRKRQTPGRPPIERGPLVSGGHQVRTDASRQIADDCRLQVHGRHDAGSIVAGLLIRQFSTQRSDVHDERAHARAGGLLSTGRGSRHAAIWCRQKACVSTENNRLFNAWTSIQRDSLTGGGSSSLTPSREQATAQMPAPSEDDWPPDGHFERQDRAPTKPTPDTPRSSQGVTSGSGRPPRRHSARRSAARASVAPTCFV